jgi:cysteine desulfurase
MDGKNKKIYLDYNATTPLRPAALEAMQAILSDPLNASAVHSFGQRGRHIVEQARNAVAKLVNVPAAQVIFNSGATEGNNTVLQHFVRSGDHILVESTAHPCMLEPAPKAARIPVDKDGLIDLDALEDMLKNTRTALVSFMLANNETGVIQPAGKIAALAKKHSALVHIDAVQAIGRMSVDLQDIGADFLTLSSHKIGGPQGVGALIIGICGVTPTLLYGGGQEKYARAGTENVAGIAGFGAAAAKAQENINAPPITMRDFEAKLRTLFAEIIIHGKKAPRIHNTTLFSLPGLTSESALIALDLDGIAVSNGSACTSGSVKASHVLKAMGVDSNIAACAIRISIGWHTTQCDLDTLIMSLKKIYGRINH